MSTHTELDFSVLGVIARDGPITAYAVRQQFKNSLVPSWSSSPGSIYPAIRRLIAGRLIRSGEVTDGRHRQQLSATPKGQDALRQWLLTVTAVLGRPSMDAIRTRAQFIERLPTKDQLRFFDDSIDATSMALSELERLSGELKLGAGERLGAEGVRAELKARLAWLKAARQTVADN